ncbi:MAG: hypothetical protein GXY83_22900 [Rhodopirellula sp.]|nr:hypothetical protein [Rhodopirellula sp.]
MTAVPDSLQSVFDRAFAGLSRGREAFAPRLVPHEVGAITSVSTGIARVSGLPGVGFDELVSFPGDVFGIAFNVDEDEIGVVLLGEYWHLHAGDEVRRTGRVMDVAVGDGLLGRVIDPLGRPLDGRGPVVAGERLPIERPAAPIMDRAPVTTPLQTGIKVIDALIPIGRGQRELILGDRQTGKTAIALDTILNQRGKSVLCVYCAIGQRAAYRAVAGDLKLAYSQFEELETFARFGARLDEDTRKIVEHGRRIRASLKQSEFDSVSVPAQIAVLLALTADLFDDVPLDRMNDAEQAVRKAAAEIPAEVRQRLETADKLSEEDREAFLESAREALAEFSSQPSSKSNAALQEESTPFTV